jgi:periplasmic protein TonB
MLKFTIWHGYAASLFLHAALALPFVMSRLAPDDELPTLVIELQGVVSDAQAEEKVAQQIPEQSTQQQQPPPQEAQPPQPALPPQAETGPELPPMQPQLASPSVEPGIRQDQPPEEQQKAQILRKDRDLEADLLREYVKRLSKKIQSNLVYPDEGRRAGWQGNVTVSFTLAQDGQIKSGTLTIVAGSGQPKLDASALATARACAPFEPPPREMTIRLVVGYGRKK